MNLTKSDFPLKDKLEEYFSQLSSNFTATYYDPRVDVIPHTVIENLRHFLKEDENLFNFVTLAVAYSILLRFGSSKGEENGFVYSLDTYYNNIKVNLNI